MPPSSITQLYLQITQLISELHNSICTPHCWNVEIELCNSGTGTPHCTVGVLKLHNIPRATKMMTDPWI